MNLPLNTPTTGSRLRKIMAFVYGASRLCLAQFSALAHLFCAVEEKNCARPSNDLLRCPSSCKVVSELPHVTLWVRARWSNVFHYMRFASIRNSILSRAHRRSSTIRNYRSLTMIGPVTHDAWPDIVIPTRLWKATERVSKTADDRNSVYSKNIGQEKDRTPAEMGRDF